MLRGLYNVFLHPLRGYPGPKLWAATQLVWIYYRLTGPLVWKSIKLHNKYGSVVRVALGHLSCLVSGEFMIEAVNENIKTDLFRLTTAETRMILAKLLWHFDIVSMPEPEGWESTQKGTVAWHRTPLMCEFKQREL